MGERSKNAKTAFKENAYNEIWQAHKLRNQLIHELDVNIKAQRIKLEYSNMWNGMVSLL